MMEIFLKLNEKGLRAEMEKAIKIAQMQKMPKNISTKKSRQNIVNNQFKSLLCDDTKSSISVSLGRHHWPSNLSFFSRHFNYIDCQTSALSTSSVSLFHDSGS